MLQILKRAPKSVFFNCYIHGIIEPIYIERLSALAFRKVRGFYQCLWCKGLFLKVDLVSHWWVCKGLNKGRRFIKEEKKERKPVEIRKSKKVRQELDWFLWKEGD